MRPSILRPPRPAACAWTLPGLLLVTLSMFASKPALTQTHSATDNAPQVQNLSNTAIGRSMTPKEVREGTAKLVSRYDPQNKLRLVLGLTPPKLAEEEKFLRELQDKQSPNYHKFLTAKEWNARFSPSEQDEQAVVDWAKNNGLTITQRYANRLIVDVEGTADVVEKAFGITLNNYQLGQKVEFSNDHDPVIPAHLVGVLRSVGGLNSMQRAHAAHENGAAQNAPAYSPGQVYQNKGSLHADGNHSAYTDALKASEAKYAQASQTLKAKGTDQLPGQVTPNITNGYIDPTDIYSSYGYDYQALQNQGHCCNPGHASTGAPSTTSIAVATAGDFDNNDIVGFHNQYPYLAYYFHHVWVDGTPSCCEFETTMDVEWSLATANSFGSYLDTAQIWTYVGANTLLSTFTDVYNKILNDGNARIMTVSWGCGEFDCADSGTMDTDHAIFNSMLGQGWTLLAASGDQGAVTGCQSHLRVNYPASDPAIIAVGGTDLSLFSDGTFSSETAWQGSTWSGACSSNYGGSGGGCSAKFSAPGYQTGGTAYCGTGSRSVPDISLNAISFQNVFFGGSLTASGGTSIASPEAAGFMAQANAYLLSLGLGWAPMGDAHYPLYYEANHPSYATHYPYYDITSGCNSNDITAAYGTGYYCAGSGYDAVTGWGSFNALQLSRAINAYFLGDFVGPTVTFSGPTVSTSSNTWFNTDQTVSWTITDTGSGSLTPVGVAGFSQSWDTPILDAPSEATQGAGDSFYSGPQFPNATSGYLQLSWAGQGCHYAAVQAWDNGGYTNGNNYYYWICYDTVTPTVSASSSPAANGANWNNTSVTVSFTASDPGGSKASGIKGTYYTVNNTACLPNNLQGCRTYTGPFTINNDGQYYLPYFTMDNAGNATSVVNQYVNIDKTAPVSSAALSGTTAGSTYSSPVKVTLSATDNLSGIAATYYQLDGGAVTTYSGPFTVSTPLGTHTVKYYSKDKAGNTEAAKTVTFIRSSTTTTTLTSTPNPSVAGQTVTLKATVTPAVSGGTPTGTITFKNGSTTIGTATLSGGVATMSTSSLPLGSDSLTAAYGGAATYRPSTSAADTQVVRQTTTTTVSSSVNPSTFGQSVTLTAKVVPSVSGTPTGSVQFYSGSFLLATVALSGNTATYTNAYFAAGTNAITAKYVGDSNYAGSTSGVLNQVVKQVSTSISLTSSLNPSTHGTSVTFTATITSPTGAHPSSGTITFKDGSTTIGTGSIASGKATFSTSALAVGTHSITASYAGTSNYGASTSPTLSQVVH